MDYVILVLPGLVVIGILWWTQRRMKRIAAEYEPGYEPAMRAEPRQQEGRPAGSVVGQSRRARRLMQVIAERFIRAYINPILDWIGRS